MASYQVARQPHRIRADLVQLCHPPPPPTKFEECDVRGVTAHSFVRYDVSEEDIDIDSEGYPNLPNGTFNFSAVHVQGYTNWLSTRWAVHTKARTKELKSSCESCFAVSRPPSQPKSFSNTLGRGCSRCHVGVLRHIACSARMRWDFKDQTKQGMFLHLGVHPFPPPIKPTPLNRKIANERFAANPIRTPLQWKVGASAC
ncbi:hypothetical protein PsorP6_003571 [Peronosclerospora sorghi]|uniref:Uncharacterized protein n=1 Tax=Peronosclerospora sorghi TaxID=230839 RepID=A0ACC0VPG2_9STRA|nr:hypothetical protein PsorP6_003571 [Peronosclerospora sorghi]